MLLKEIEQTPALILYATADDTTTTTNNNDVLCDFAILLSSESWLEKYEISWSVPMTRCLLQEYSNKIKCAGLLLHCNK